MARRTSSLPAAWTAADLLDHLGNIAPQRIRVNPPLGLATERDVITIQEREDRLYELVDGVLVEKVRELRESCLASDLIYFLNAYVKGNDLGFVSAPDGTVRLAPRLVRIPDVSFIPWDRLPSKEYPDEPIPELAPALAVEVLSEGNTPKEMARKLKEYFFAGVLLVWFVDPDKRTVEVFTAPDCSTTLTENQTLDGGAILPGFSLPLRELFARVKRSGRRGNGKKKSGKNKS